MLMMKTCLIYCEIHFSNVKFLLFVEKDIQSPEDFRICKYKIICFSVFQKNVGRKPDYLHYCNRFADL